MPRRDHQRQFHGVTDANDPHGSAHDDFAAGSSAMVCSAAKSPPSLASMSRSRRPLNWRGPLCVFPCSRVTSWQFDVMCFDEIGDVVQFSPHVRISQCLPSRGNSERAGRPAASRLEIVAFWQSPPRTHRGDLSSSSSHSEITHPQ